MTVAALYAFIGGLVAGSFVTAVAHRVPRKESIVGPRSRCPACGKSIGARDNIPVISWLLLRGRARCCGVRISPRYPLTELAVGGLYAATVIVHWGDASEIAVDLVFVTMLAAITLTDLEQRLIPNKILVAGAIACLLIALATDLDSMPERLLFAAVAGGFFFLIVLAYPAGMGLGDLKLAATMGLFLGKSVGLAILIGFVVGGLVGVVLLIRHGAEARKMAVPFGQFLALGGVVAMLAGDPLLDLYLG